MTTRAAPAAAQPGAPRCVVTSGLRTLPMVVGMLVTSTGSGVVVGRTGRYKIFPVTGTALMAVAFVLMSRMDATTPAVVQSPYLLVLGAGIGFSMQVPVFVVQCTSDFEDPGVATSGVTFFRTIGGSFGAAVLGSLFVNFLPDRLGPALASNGSSAESVNSPEALHRQPLAEGHLSCRPTPNHWARFSLGRNGCRRRFRPGAVLREAPPRDIHNSAVDLGDGFGMPTTETPETLLENAIGRMLRGDPGMRLRSIAMRPDCRLDVAGLWALPRINRYQQYFGAAPSVTTWGHPSRSWSPPSAAGCQRICGARRRSHVADRRGGPPSRLRVLAAVELDR